MSKSQYDAIAHDAATKTLRAEYVAIRTRAPYISASDFNAAVAEILTEHNVADASPAQYVKAAKLVQTGCICRDGKHYSGGMVLNGVYTGKVGKCYRCDGKAYQIDADRRRNYGYDKYHRSVAP